MKYYLYSFISKIAHFIFGKQKIKLLLEYGYWKVKKLQERIFTNDHYEFLYTEVFGMDTDFYRNKKILDIGCGPRGSLEWADNAGLRVGLDPLVTKYVKLGIGIHAMDYVQGFSEDIPFPGNYFDVVSSFNSLARVS